MAARVRCHEEDGNYACSICSYQSNDKNNLRNHTRQIKHSSADLEYICVYCKQEWKTSKGLKTHEETHRVEGAPRNRCEYCEHEFLSRADLRQHMRVTHRVMREDWENMRTERSSVAQRTEQTVERMDEDQSNAEEPNQPERKSCNRCGVTCNGVKELLIHRKTQHFSHKPCKNLSSIDPTKRCTYGQDCSYSHIPITEGKNRCFDCGQEFDSQNGMMDHRKGHQDKVIICLKYVRGQCTRGTDCWFDHPISGTTSGTNTQGFHPRVEVWEPPARREEKLRETLQQMIPQILSQIMQQMNI